jgi:dTMP kinase
MPRGKFIVLEGLEGSGKSTQAKLLKTTLEAQGEKTHLLREPGGTEVGEVLRTLLKNMGPNLDPISQLFLFNASRRELCKKVILPLINQGENVICDRFYPSTLAYQGIYTGHQTAESACLAAIEGCEPDVILFLHIGWKEALLRTKKRGELDNIEKNLEWERVETAYLTLAETSPQNWIVVTPTELDPPQTHKTILEALHQKGLCNPTPQIPCPA